jgi:hypothetical protein
MELPETRQLESLGKGALLQIVENLSLSEINNLCQTSKRINSLICGNQRYWKGKIEKEFPYWPITNLAENQYLPMYKYLTARKRWFERGGQDSDTFITNNEEYNEMIDERNRRMDEGEPYGKLQLDIGEKANALDDKFRKVQEREEKLMQEAKKQLPKWGNLYVIWIDPRKNIHLFRELIRAVQISNADHLQFLAEKFRDDLPRYMGDADFIVIYMKNFDIPIVEYYIYADQNGKLETQGILNNLAIREAPTAFLEVPEIMYGLEGNMHYIKEKYPLRGKLI